MNLIGSYILFRLHLAGDQIPSVIFNDNIIDLLKDYTEGGEKYLY